MGEEAFEHLGPLITFKAGIPKEVEAIRIAYFSPVSLGAQLEDVLTPPSLSEGLAIVPVPVP